MPRLTIQQFSTTLSAGPDRDVLVRAYRALSARPHLAAAMRAMDWVARPPAAAPETAA